MVILVSCIAFYFVVLPQIVCLIFQIPLFVIPIALEIFCLWLGFHAICVLSLNHSRIVRWATNLSIGFQKHIQLNPISKQHFSILNLKLFRVNNFHVHFFTIRRILPTSLSSPAHRLMKNQMNKRKTMHAFNTFYILFGEHMWFNKPVNGKEQIFQFQCKWDCWCLCWEWYWLFLKIFWPFSKRSCNWKWLPVIMHTPNLTFSLKKS